MPGHPLPEKVKYESIKDLYDVYKREYLGQTIQTISGHRMTFKPGHFFRLIAQTPEDGIRKGFIAKAANAKDAIRMIENGEINGDDIAGFDSARARKMMAFKDILTDGDFYYPEENKKIIFGKKYSGVPGADGFLAVTMEIDSDGNLGPLSFSQKRFTKNMLKDKKIKWHIANSLDHANAPGDVSSRGKSTELANNLSPSPAKVNPDSQKNPEKSSDDQSGKVFSLRKHQQVNPVVVNGQVQAEYADLLDNREYTPETIADWDQRAIAWIDRQGGIEQAAKQIANDTEHSDRHVATLVRRHVLNSEFAAYLPDEIRMAVELKNISEGTAWGREGAARRLAALTLENIDNVKALFRKLHENMPDRKVKPVFSKK